MARFLRLLFHHPAALEGRRLPTNPVFLRPCRRWEPHQGQNGSDRHRDPEINLIFGLPCASMASLGARPFARAHRVCHRSPPSRRMENTGTHPSGVLGPSGSPGEVLFRWTPLSDPRRRNPADRRLRRDQLLPRFPGMPLTTLVLSRAGARQSAQPSSGVRNTVVLARG